ncbi:putative nuclease HARBI1 [Culicoides brevitarsis]|uniref:putative nuclease HARBI1 n=1 Tax=Culicoides brevitarsis TaxID=469753 RepID=UPI00307C5B07
MYNEDQFHNFFRMTRTNMENFLMKIAPKFPRSKSKIRIEKKIMIAVWTLATQETYCSIADRFGCATGTIFNIVREVFTVLKKNISDVVIFPNETEKIRISKVFKKKSKIPGIIGSIDGSHIAIKAPSHNNVDYYNRKQHHSFILQGICDDHLRFTDIYVGAPGRMHDAKVFKCSPIFLKLNEIDFLSTEHHLMGDGAYPNNKFMITPFRDNGQLDSTKTSFNISLSSVRQCIERAFGLLKTKFRRLRYIDIENANFGIDMVVSAIYLHNFILNEMLTECETEEPDEDNNL